MAVRLFNGIVCFARSLILSNFSCYPVNVINKAITLNGDMYAMNTDLSYAGTGDW